jgi:60 kDa SS-A/Ro ribonucleoprotein
MSRVKQVFEGVLPTTTNHEGYPAYIRPIKEQYLQALLTNTLGNTFYADRNVLLQEALDLHAEMMRTDPAYAARALVYARNEGLMRLQPILGLVYLSQYDTALFSRIFSQIIRIPPDLADFLTILSGLGRGQGGRAIKREVAGFLNGIDEYWALKYNGRGRGYNLGDAIATAHPVPRDERQNQLFRYLTGQAAQLQELPQIAAFEALKRADNDEQRIRHINEGRLPHEVVTGTVQPTPAVWQAILHQLPLFALLRNLNTLDRVGILDENRDYISRRLTDREALQKAKIMPFRFVNAFEQVHKAWMRDVLRQAVEMCFANLPVLNGRSAIFLDISGSMSGEFIRIGSVFALALFKLSGGQAIFWLFDTEVYDAQASLHDSILSQAEKIKARGGTDTGAPLRALRSSREKVDNIIMITDEQQNTGSPFYNELQSYRRKYNPDTRAFIIDVAPYQGALVPPVDDLTHYIYGWADTVVKYIVYSIDGYAGMAERVQAIEL